MVGQQIGDFQIVQKLGEGGMGVVYKAVDVHLGRPVAIKMLAAGLTDNPELLQRFQSEARAQANLSHTNLATLYAFLVDQGNAYMVMEFVEGETFDQIIRRNGPINLREAIPWFKQALLGIGAAHRVGIIHRDIKPSNLMLNRQGIVKVMDFGIAKAVGTRGLTRTGMQLGTLAYMSPEQIQNRNVDVRSDIYSLGVTLYEMLSGHVPFESDSDFQVMHDHVNTPPPPMTRYFPYAPQELEGVVERALAKNPDERFQTVEEFGAALEHPANFAAAPPAYAPVSPPVSPIERRTVLEGMPGAGTWQGAAPGVPAGPVGRTVLEPAAGAGQWRGTAQAPGAPPAAYGGQTIPGGAPAGMVAGPGTVVAGQPSGRKISPRLGLFVAGGAVAVLAIALAISMFSGRHNGGGGGGGGANSGGGGGGTVQTGGGGPSGPEIVVAEGTPGQPAGGGGGNPSGGGGTRPSTTQPSGGGGQPRPHAGGTHPQQTQPPAQPQQQPTQPQQQPVNPPQQQLPPHQQQPPAQAAAQSFIVKHRHVVRNGLNTQTFFCAGALLLMHDGSVSYNCAATNDPSGRCEHVTFPVGSIRQLKLKSGELHMATSTLGNWDFYDYTVAGAVTNAYDAILPFVR